MDTRHLFEIFQESKRIVSVQQLNMKETTLEAIRLNVTLGKINVK